MLRHIHKIGSRIDFHQMGPFVLATTLEKELLALIYLQSPLTNIYIRYG